MCAIDLGIFVTNGGYHYEEEVESNWFSPMLATKTSRRMAENGGESRSSHAWLTAANDVDWAAWKSCRPILAISTPMDWLMPLFEGYHCQSHHMVMNRREEREVSKRERERNKKERAEVRKRKRWDKWRKAAVWSCRSFVTPLPWSAEKQPSWGAQARRREGGKVSFTPLMVGHHGPIGYV